MAVSGLDLPDKTKSVIAALAAKENFSNYKAVVSAGSSKGDNYLGLLYRVKIEGKNKNGTAANLSLIIKSAPSNAVMREKMRVRNVFEMEIFAYESVLPALETLQIDLSLADNQRFQFAKCYYCSMEEMDEMLVMEDLAVEGFVMYDRKKSLDMPHAKKAVGKLAQFHALSFVLQKKDPAKFSIFKQRAVEQLFIKDTSNIHDYMQVAIAKAVGSIENPVHKEKFRAYTDDIFNKICELMIPDDENLSNVLCHGDSWTNNFLFKYENGKPIDLRILDWQFMRYGSPASDLLYLIFCCTDSEFRSRHYEDLLRHYYDTFDGFLAKFSLKAEQLYPRSAFDGDMKKYSLFGVGMAIMTLLLFTCDSDDVPDIGQLLEDGNTISADFSTGQSALLYNSRMNGVVTDCIKYNYI